MQKREGASEVPTWETLVCDAAKSMYVHVAASLRVKLPFLNEEMLKPYTLAIMLV